MKITKTYQEHLAHMRKAADVVAYLQARIEDGETKSLLTNNALSMALCAGDGLIVLLRRIEKDMMGDNRGPATVQGDLFPPTPEERAVSVRDLRDLVEGWFRATHEEDDTGKAEDPDVPAAAVRSAFSGIDGTWPPVEVIAGWTPAERVEVDAWITSQAYGERYDPPEALVLWLDSVQGNGFDLPMKVKIEVHKAGTFGLHEEELADLVLDFDEDDTKEFKMTSERELERVLWAMVHTGELALDSANMVYTCEGDIPSVDVMAMLEKQPELGTEDGLPSDLIEVIPFDHPAVDDRPEQADAVATYVLTNGPLTRLEVIDHFIKEDVNEMEVSKALDWLVECGDLQQNDKTVDAACYESEADLEQWDMGDLQDLYAAETGRKPGNRSREALIERIQEARRGASEDEPADDTGPQEVEA